MDLIEQDFKNYELRHPWEVERFKFFSQLSEQFIDKNDPQILDFGAGDCWLGHNLALNVSKKKNGASITFVDTNLTPEIISRITDLTKSPVRKTFQKNLPAMKFDYVFALDVFEHIVDDVGGLFNLRDKVMSKDTLLFLSLPSVKSVMGGHDMKLGHFRRYSGAEAEKLVRDAGLQILRKGNLFPTLAVARIVDNLMYKLSGKSHSIEVRDHKHFILNAVGFLGKLDMIIERSLNYRIPGLTWWAVCKVTNG